MTQAVTPTPRHASLHRLLGTIKRPLSGLALCALLLVSATSCKDHYENGMDAIVEQRWDDARNEARLGKAQDPADARYDLLMARALVNEAMSIEQAQSADGQHKVESRKATALYNKALPYAKRAYDSGELDATAGRVLGKIYWEQTKPELTCQAWKRARAADPKSIADTDYLTACRNALKHTEDYDEFARALEIRSELKAFMEQKPEFIKSQGPEVERELQKLTSEEAFRTNKEKYAQELTDQRAYEDAIVVYSELSKQYPEESKYHYQRGKLLLELGKAQEASDAFDAYTQTPDKRERIERLKDVARKAEERSVRSIAMRANIALLDELPDTPSRERALIYFKLANINFQIDELDEARKYAKQHLEELKALDGAPLKADQYLNIFRQAMQHGHAKVGMEFLEQALVEAPPNINVMEQLANEYARQARKGDTERVLKTFVERSGDTRKSLEQAARWSTRRRNWDLAQFFYEKITERDDAIAEDWYELARIYSSQARLDELRTAIEAYLKMRGHDRRSISEAARLYEEQRLYEEAEKLLKVAQKKYPEDQVIAQRLVHLYDQGDWGKPDAAHEVWNRWLDARGRKGDDLVVAGSHYRNQGRGEEALPYYKEAADKGQRDARIQIAQIYKMQNRDAELKAELDKYLESSPNRRAALVQVLQIYSSTTLTDATIEVLKELISIDPRQRQYYEKLSELYLQQGREREAFSLWSTYLEGSRDPYRDLKQMAPFFQQRGNQEWVLSLYQQLLDKGQVDAQIYEIVGEIFYDLYRQLHARAPGSEEEEAALAKATVYYKRYFQESKPSGSALSRFAADMKQKGLFELSELAYSRMLESGERTQNVTHYNHGEVLIRLGRMEEAEEAMERYYKAANRTDGAAQQIAVALTIARRYKAAEVYLLKLLESSSHQKRETAFLKLAEIYRESDRIDEMKALVTRYLNRSSNVNAARERIIGVAMAAGMWDLAIEQLEQTARSKNRGLRYNIGEFQWKAGRPEEAQKTFSEFATNSDRPVEEWHKVGVFYETHGKPALAAMAYENAIKADPNKVNPLLARGRLALVNGNVKQALADFEQAIEIAPASDLPRIYELLVDEFRKVGRYDEVRRFAREGLKLPGADRTFFLAPLADEAFGKGEKLAADRMLTELKAAGMLTGELVNVLVQYGFYEEAAQTIEEEIAVGDYISAGTILMEQAEIFTTLGGVDRLMRAAQPLLDKSRGDARLESSLGEFLIREGHFERGAIFLRAALDKNQLQWRMLLAHTNLKLGYEREAYKLFLDELAQSSARLQPEILDEILMSYTLTKNTDKIRPLLEHLVQDERFIKVATPRLISRMLEDGNILAATAMVRDFGRAGRKGEDGPTPTLLIGSDVDDAQYREVFLVGASTLASYGYIAEAHALLLGASDEIKESPSFKTLEFKLGLMAESADTEQLLMRYVDNAEDASREARVRNLELAYVLMLRDKHAEARKIAERELDSGEPEIADAALNVLMRSAYITKEFDKQSEWANRFLSSQPDRQRTREQLARLYGALGQDERAMTLAIDNLEKMPVVSNIKLAQKIARRKGDPAAFERYTKMLWRVHDNPVQEARIAMGYYSTLLSPEFLAPATRPVRATYPENKDLLFLESLQLMRVGKVVEGRELLVTFLEEREWEETVVEIVLLELVSHSLWVEAARAIGKKIPEERINNRSRLYLGLAEAGLGFEDEARVHLDLYVQSHHQPGWASLRVAKLMYGNDANALFTHYAEQAVRKTPVRPEPYYWRGLARLRAGDVDGARKDFDRSLDSGINRPFALQRIIIEAAKGGHLDLAEEKSLTLLHDPFVSTYAERPSSNMAFRAMLDYWLLAGKPKEGLAIIEEHYPQALTLDIESASIPTSLTSMYEGAELHEQGWRIYEHLIRKEFLRDTFGDGIATYNNNLAYSYSTTNKNVSEGELLVRRAIAASWADEQNKRSPGSTLAQPGKRQNSYIDTLGWIYYRQGKFDQAAREIQRALYDKDEARPNIITDPKELLEHLADIREAQGYQEEATWIRLHVETLQ